MFSITLKILWNHCSTIFEISQCIVKILLFQFVHLFYKAKKDTENKYCKNYFVFQKGESVVTLYYQPVVYNNDKRSVANIGLYRNTSISFPKSLDDDLITGKYYTPDFIIKIESANGNGAKYIIADAKFSTLDNVKKRQVAALA